MSAPDYARFLSPPTTDNAQASPTPPVPTAADENDLPAKLDAVTARALNKLDEFLALPIDTADGNRTRAQTAAINTALTTQSRVDEMRLRARSNPDIMSKIIELMKEEELKLAIEEGGLEDQPWPQTTNARPR
jgi:hypothetical protein